MRFVDVAIMVLRRCRRWVGGRASGSGHWRKLLSWTGSVRNNFPPRGGGGGVRVGAAGLGVTKCSLGSALETAAS